VVRKPAGEQLTAWVVPASRPSIVISAVPGASAPGGGAAVCGPDEHAAEVAAAAASAAMLASDLNLM
jgi:hypothetical protein